MKRPPSSLDRLLRAAAAASPNEPAAELPFGFESRVLAHWRETWPGDPAGIARLLRRVVYIALALLLLAGAGAYREWNEEAADSLGNEYAIADSAIGGAFER